MAGIRFNGGQLIVIGGSFHNNAGSGIVVGPDTDVTVLGSSIYMNGGTGVRLLHTQSERFGDKNMKLANVKGNFIAGNAGDGIRTERDANIENNIIQANGGSGIVIENGSNNINLSAQKVAEIKAALGVIHKDLGVISDQNLAALAEIVLTRKSKSDFIGRVRKNLPEMADIVTVAAPIIQAVSGFFR